MPPQGVDIKMVVLLGSILEEKLIGINHVFRDDYSNFDDLERQEGGGGGGRERSHTLSAAW
jgi:hypothetical protein